MKKQISFLISIALLIIMFTFPANGAMSDSKFVRLCRIGTVESVFDALLDGANPNAQRHDGLTALMAAAGGNKDSLVTAALIGAGADVNASVNGLTALMLAAILNPNARVASTLIKYGADVNASVEGLTPLLLAVEFNDNPEVTEVLLNAPGIDLVDEEIDWLDMQKDFAAERAAKKNAKLAKTPRTSSSNKSKQQRSDSDIDYDPFSFGNLSELGEAGGYVYFFTHGGSLAY